MGVFASLMQRLTITCEHLDGHQCIMPFYKEVHLGPIQMNCICVGPINLGTQSKLLLQLPSTFQALVFLLKYRTWKVNKCLDQPNARYTFHLGQKHIPTNMIGWTFLIWKWPMQWLQSTSHQLWMWGKPMALILLSPTMIRRFLNAYVGTTFGELNIIPQSQTIIAQCCQKTLNITTKQ